MSHLYKQTLSLIALILIGTFSLASNAIELGTCVYYHKGGQVFGWRTGIAKSDDCSKYTPKHSHNTVVFSTDPALESVSNSIHGEGVHTHKNGDTHTHHAENSHIHADIPKELLKLIKKALIEKKEIGKNSSTPTIMSVHYDKWVPYDGDL